MPSGTGAGENQRAKSKGPAWMGTGSARGPKKPEPMWKPSAPKQADPEARQRAIRALVAVTAAVLLAGFIYYLLTRPEPTPLIVLRASAYHLQMPPLAFAEEDAELLGKISPHNVRITPVDLTSSGPSLEAFRDALKKVGGQFNPWRRGSDVVIVYVAAHGVVNEQGQPCLVPPEENPFDSGTWLPLAQLFQAVQDQPALKDKKKLIVLDCQRVVSCWRCGWLENRFADELAGAVQAADDPTLYVIAAAGPGEVGWAAPELRGTLFGHFLARALRGEANAAGGSVSLNELFHYVATQVDGYSKNRRGARQQPVLLHGDKTYRLEGDGRVATGEDFTLAYIDSWRRNRPLTELQSEFDPLEDAKRLLGSPATENATAASSGSGYALYQLWQRYRERRQFTKSGDQKAASLPGYVCDPVAWSSIEQRLAAIGERLLAGKQYQGPALQTELDRLGKDLDDDDLWAPRGTLPMLDQPQVAAGSGADRRTARAARGGNLFEAYWKAEPEKRPEVLPRNVARERLVADMYEALGDAPRSGGDARRRLGTAAELLRGLPGSTARTELIESHFLTLLDRGLPAGDPLSAAHLALALKARQTAEQAANPTDLRTHYVIESLVNAADDKRRQAEDQFFLLSDPRRAESLWGEAAGSPQGGWGYDAAIRRADQVAEYFRLRDETWADLPLLAEWQFAHARLAGESPSPQPLADVIGRSIEVDYALERLLRSRDEDGTLATWQERCDRSYQALSQQWRMARAGLETVYERPTTVEQRYSRPEDVRDAELALRWPPLVGSTSQFLERYLQTLRDWAKEGTAAVATAATSVSAGTVPAGNVRAALTSPNTFLRELHRALAYEFIDPYEQHRHWTQWDDNPFADFVFRGSGDGGQSTWNRLRQLLDAYNVAILKESPTWSDSQRAVAAAAKLRQWDRRVRLGATWLSSFQSDLRRPSQSTPTGWLQEYDAAHVTAWHGYRVLSDFWGSGEPGASAQTPYFADAIQQCDASLPVEMRPIRYDLPGQTTVVSFKERDAAALAALSQWQPIHFPRSLDVSTGASAQPKFDVAVQPAGEIAKELRLPPGVASLLFVPGSGGSSTRITFDADGQQRTQAVPLPISGAPPSFMAYVQPAAERQPRSSVAGTEARLWYRGHVRGKPCPDTSARQFVRYESVRPLYPAPTVQVRGKDTIRGALLFVFDCSRSMQGGGFPAAQGQLATLLNDLARDPGISLKIGLMAYGRRTNAGAGYYRGDRRREQNDSLAPRGLELQRSNPAFVDQQPHPDGDVQTLVALQDGKANTALAALRTMREEECVGITPLYYSARLAIDKALQESRDAPARWVVIISDGVNMPYDISFDERTRNYVMGATGQRVNADDYAALDGALQACQGAVHVSIQLFGGRATNFESQQYQSLKRLDQEHPNLEVVDVPDPRLLRQSIFDSFPKTQVELTAEQSTTQVQKLALNDEQKVSDWRGEGLLRPELDRRTVRLKPPGENRSLDSGLELLGGERVVINYDARLGRLTYENDGLTWRNSNRAQSLRAADNRRLLFDALDPERVGPTINRFHFRIRDEDLENRFTPRPKYVWLELTPRTAGGDTSDQVFPCIDAAWVRNINFPVLQMPVDGWPESSRARVQAWFRYTEPVAAHQATVSRGQSGMTLPLGADKWRVEQTGGEPGTARKITVIWEPRDSAGSAQALFDRAVWAAPAPDTTRRHYSVDGSAAIHEFIYSRADAANEDVRLRIVSRSDFQQGAYFAEFDFDLN